MILFKKLNFQKFHLGIYPSNFHRNQNIKNGLVHKIIYNFSPEEKKSDNSSPNPSPSNFNKNDETKNSDPQIKSYFEKLMEKQLKVILLKVI